MRSPRELTTLFRQRGLRVTPQRERIFHVLSRASHHPTVEDVYQEAREELSTLSRKTVYQTVNDLAELGEVHLLDLGTGSHRIDPNVEHAHSHFVCTRCGRLLDLHAETPPAGVPMELLQGFVVQAMEVTFRGLCDQCVARSSMSTAEGDSHG
jgi:Fe2+ or Zn2+ uptake regulation protein